MKDLRVLGGTFAPGSETGVSVPPRSPEPVTRRYRPESAALDELVEVLYRLLVDVPANESAASESTCFPVTHE